MSELQRWQERLAELTRHHEVPGAALAVSVAGESWTVASGVLNIETGVEATTDSLFQIGSITKPYTAALLLRLAEQSGVDIDKPVAAALDGFRLADAAATEQVTFRQLLTHSSGIEGDHFLDTGRGDDAIARYLASCAELGLSHPVGATFSYCNTGYVIAGALIEQLTGQPWSEAVRTELLDPLGLTSTTVRPEQAMRFRVAYGHDVTPGQPPTLAKSWMLPYSAAPAGSALCATAADLAAFGWAHLSGEHETVLPAAQVAAMWQPEVEVPDRWTLGPQWGLGWIVYDWGGHRVVGHDGATLGQAAFLRVLPEQNAVIGLVTNGGRARDLLADLLTDLLPTLGPARLPEPLTPTPSTSDSYADFLGTYQRLGMRIDIADTADGLTATVRELGPLADMLDRPPTVFKLTAAGDGVFVTYADGSRTPLAVVFYALADGSQYVHMAARATPKLAGTPR